MISIVICTRNRAELLGFCLESFCHQTAPSTDFELIVVDNASTDSTQQVVESYQRKLNKLSYCVESQTGLSHARNKGYHQAKFDWVSYIDDDAKAHSNYVERALWVISHYSFKCFGGRFYPWYKEPKPDWLPADFGLFPLWLSEVGELPVNQDVAGGVIVFEKSALAEVGGFPVHLGMSGDQVGYGEENWVQLEFRKRGYRIGFDPEFQIDHLVASYKYRVSWHLKRQYAKGRDAAMLGLPHGNRVKQSLKALLFTVKECFVNGFKLLVRPNYYWQNFVLDSFGYLYRTWGEIRK